jgi:hypothetical protein
MKTSRTIAEARLRSMRAELLRGRALLATRRAEEIREETRAMRAAIRQRRLAEHRHGAGLSDARRSAARR